METTTNTRTQAVFAATERSVRKIELTKSNTGKTLSVPEIFGENVFDFTKAEGIPENVRTELLEVARSGKQLNREHVEIVANAATEWAISKGATHFSHWFQPLTGNTAEKHDAFLQIKNGEPIEKISVSQLIQGEPDASSFPNGGSRSTFEARGYTAWDITSPMFLTEGPNGKTLCIPTAFISYQGDALDIKTPLLRSVSKLNEVGTKYLNLLGYDSKFVNVTCGSEQEYFLIDKAFAAARPDLTMSERTLFGSLPAKNQQLDDHYFGDIPTRVIGFMQELDHELYKLGVPAKTRHNEVAPSQFEIAPIFTDANVASDQNQLMMATIKKVAAKHDFVAILHEKPFAKINGSGKHLNWSMSDNNGLNLLEPGNEPQANQKFLATVSIIAEAVYRHADALRMAISGHGNDHRLGANEAPPSIISVYVGDTIEKIFNSILEGKSFSDNGETSIDLGATQLAKLFKDNTDRNRTSPFAFTGNKFEFRAVGSSQAIGFPMTILNAAVSEVMAEANAYIENELGTGKTLDTVLSELTKKNLESCHSVIFNGDGYSREWVEEAERRGLPNLRTTPEALSVLANEESTAFLRSQEIYSACELETRYNVLVEKYVLAREIEFKTLISMINQSVLPGAITYKNNLATTVRNLKEVGLEGSVELEMLKKVQFATEKLMSSTNSLSSSLEELEEDHAKAAATMATELLPLSEEVANVAAELEEIIPDSLWELPKYREMLFIK